MFLKVSLALTVSFFSNVYSQKIEKSPANYFAPECPRDNRLRRHSLPFITGDSFRFFADHVFDEASNFEPEDVGHGDTIFVSGWFLRCFFATKHVHIKSKYILITGNSDIDIDSYFLPYLQEEKIKFFFATNALLNHPKLIGIPIGLSNSYWKHGDIAILRSIAEKAAGIAKSYLVNLSFATYTNPTIRQPIYDFFAGKDYCKAFVSRDGSDLQNYELYLNNLSSCCFAVSPFGNGLDCHRVWEACWVGCIPMVQSSPLDNVYRDLPILMVKDFFSITESFLREKYIEISENIKNKKYIMEKLYFQYWMEEIRKAQRSLR